MASTKMDKRRRGYAAVDVMFGFSTTAERLEDEFGSAGPYAWLLMILAAKRAPIQGEFTVASEAEFWSLLGMRPPEGVSMDSLLRLLGQLKQTSRRPLGRALNVTLTNFEEWQKLPATQGARERNARKRAQTTRNDTEPLRVVNANDTRTERRGNDDEEIPTESLLGDDASGDALSNGALADALYEAAEIAKNWNGSQGRSFGEAISEIEASYRVQIPHLEYDRLREMTYIGKEVA